jgi:hypothetical protein
LSASNITMSFLVPVPPIASPPALPPAPTGIPPAPQASAPAPAAGSFRSSESIKLPDIKDAKVYLDHHELIQYYLRFPNYSTQRSESLLITDVSNSEASQFWEGLIRTAIKDGSLYSLFNNKGTLYYGKGFEMLAALDQHCHPDTVANAFTTLMSLFNDVQGNSEPIMEFCSHFDGMVMDMTWCKSVISLILLVMFFLCALHGHYTDLLKQFCSCFKVLEDASINSVVEDVRYHDSFTLAGPKKSPLPSGSWIPKASAANANKQGQEWNNPFEWLSSYYKKGIKTHWTRALAGMGICPICHRAKKPWHVPANCPPPQGIKSQVGQRTPFCSFSCTSPGISGSGSGSGSGSCPFSWGACFAGNWSPRRFY